MNKSISDVKGIVTDIQRFSVHDGMGIRTIVFLKGCPLHCKWCHNPETNSTQKQLLVYRDKCIGCGECVRVCPEKCITADGMVDRTACTVCGKCAEICCTGSKSICGEEVSAAEVAERICADIVFFKRSKGGITLSGGEPTASPQFAQAILQLVKNQGINTAIETSGYCQPEIFAEFFDLVDMFLFDIKHTNPERHRDGTGVDNKLIQKNLFQAAQHQKKIVIRYPMIPGYNDDFENLQKTAEIACEVNALEIHVLPFHQLGAVKWKAMDKAYGYAEQKPPDEDSIRKAVSVLETSGCIVNVNGYGEYRL